MRLVRNQKTLKQVRSQLRKNMPAPEVILWQHLRGDQCGVKFRRQYSAGRFILDFYAPAVQLGIEIDGESHFRDDHAQLKDVTRDAVLQKDGIKVLRFLNTDIMKNIEGVLEKIVAEVQVRTTPS